MQRLKIEVLDSFDKSLFETIPTEIPKFLRDPDVFETLWNCQKKKKRVVAIYEYHKLIGLFPLYYIYHSLERFNEAQQKSYKKIISNGYWTMLGADILPQRYLFTKELNKIASVIPPSVCIYEVPEQYADLDGVFPCDSSSIIKLPDTSDEYVKQLSKRRRNERKKLYDLNKDIVIKFNETSLLPIAIRNLWLPYWSKRGSLRGNEDWSETLIAVYKVLIDKGYMKTATLYLNDKMIGMNFFIIDNGTFYDLCFARDESLELKRRLIGIYDVYKMIDFAILEKLKNYDLLDSGFEYKHRYNPIDKPLYAFAVVREGEDKVFSKAKVVSRFDYRYFDDLSNKGGIQGDNEDKVGCGADYESWEKEAKKLYAMFNPRTFLDAGCAKGWLVGEMQKLGVDSIGIDISDYSISCACSEVKIEKASVDDIPFINKSFDLVNCCAVVQYLPKEKAIKSIDELCRVASKNIVFYARPNIISKFDGTEEEKEILSQGYTYKPKEFWINLFEERGFSLIKEINDELFLRRKDESL